MKLKFNKFYLAITIFLFITEVLIATYLKSGFIRHTFGDYLVVILIYTFVKSFVNINPFKLALAVWVFSFFIEFLQLLDMLSILGLHQSHLAELIFGTTFQISDLVAYTLGILTILFIEFKLQRT